MALGLNKVLRNTVLSFGIFLYKIFLVICGQSRENTIISSISIELQLFLRYLKAYNLSPSYLKKLYLMRTL